MTKKEKLNDEKKERIDYVNKGFKLFDNVAKVVDDNSKVFFDEAKKFTEDVAVPTVKKAVEATAEFAQDKAIPTAKDVTDKTVKAVKETSEKVVNKVKTSITEEQMQEILTSLYVKSVDGIPKVSLPIDDLVKDYISKNPNVELAAKSLIKNSTIKCGASGFVTSFGGFAAMIATLPANITSVMYVQLRMCCAIAKMAGYDIHSDQVQTLIFACLTGSAMSDVLKQAGVKFTNKIGAAMIEKIPGKTLTVINQKVGFRFITKFGETGIVNLGKLVPVAGGIIGGGSDVARTQIIGNNAFSLFFKGKIPSKEEIENSIPVDVEAVEVEDIDNETLKNAINEGVTLEKVKS